MVKWEFLYRDSLNGFDLINRFNGEILKSMTNERFSFIVCTIYTVHKYSVYKYSMQCYKVTNQAKNLWKNFSCLLAVGKLTMCWCLIFNLKIFSSFIVGLVSSSFTLNAHLINATVLLPLFSYCCSNQRKNQIVLTTTRKVIIIEHKWLWNFFTANKDPWNEH